MNESARILLLAGTLEARQLAAHLKDQFPRTRVIASFAGAVSKQPDLGVETRTGGFGGAEGLSAYLKRHQIDLIVDATHPFAAQMSRHAVLAAQECDVPLVRLERPEWTAISGDLWTHFSDLAAAADALPAGCRVFLAIGRQDIGAFTDRDDIFGLARMIEPPGVLLPDHWELQLSRPAQSASDEEDLYRKYGITHLVSKNSGGTRSFAKISAARNLGLPVLMIDRPEISGGQVANTIDGVLEFIRQN